MKCMICHRDGEKHALRHINLYVVGSEGLALCYKCEMEMVEHVRGKIYEHGIRRKEEFKKRKAKKVFKESVEAFPFLDHLFGKYFGGKKT